jgi:phage gpG-like protein
MAFSPEKFARFVRELDDGVRNSDQSEMHDAVGERFRDAQAGNFARASDESGSQWPPRKHKYPWPILRKTRKMLGAASRLGAPGNIHRSSGRKLRLGISNSDVPYAKYHQYGTIRLPVRRFFYLRREDRRGLREPIRSHLLSVFNRTKGKYRGR